MSQMGLRPSVGNFSDTPSDRMSLVGHFQTSTHSIGMSALPPTEDSSRTSRHFRKVPDSDIGSDDRS